MDFATIIVLFLALGFLFTSHRDRQQARDRARRLDLSGHLLFGWTVLGWIAALIWAIVEKPKIKAGVPLPV